MSAVAGVWLRQPSATKVDNMNPRFTLVLVFLGWATLPHRAVEAQRRRPPDARRAIREIMDSSRVGSAMSVMLSAAHPAHEKDMLADSIVAAVRRLESNRSSRNLRLQKQLVEVIAFAGRGDGGATYHRAGELLSLIARDARSVAPVALLGISQLPSRREALERLAEAAQSEHQAAYTAVRLLAAWNGTEGLARLRNLFDNASVVNPLAIRELHLLADARGWK